MLPPEQIVWLAPVKADGNGFTVTVTLLLFVQPVDVMVSVREYIVVTAGATVGLAAIEVKPTGLDTQL